jgi:probable HAF family extracellular repeat protein
MKTRMRLGRGPIWLPALWLFFLLSPAAAQFYSVTDLGTLPGGTYSAATGINSFGQVVGYSNGPPTQHAFLWSKEHGMQDLGTLFSGGPSWGAGINDLGHVTGGSWVDDADNGAFLWTPEQGMQEIVYVNDGQGGLAINDFDEVAGSTTVEPPEAFIWTRKSGELNLTTILGGFGGSANGVNDQRQVVGYYDSLDGSFHAYRWKQQFGVEDLGEGFANAINFFGNVVGINSASHAFLWTPAGGMQDLGVLAGDDESSAAAINILGQVVGTSGSRAFHWSPSMGMQDLNTLIPPDSGWTLSSATGINVFGQIVGDGTVNGQYHAFLLTLTRGQERSR